MVEKWILALVRVSQQQNIFTDSRLNISA
jgi:hypothetical protein